MKKKVNELNIHRAIACISVVLVHISAGLIFLGTTGLEMKFLLSFINRSLKFTTPTFIFISGFILFYVYQNREINYLSFWKKRLGVILGPYILWTIFYYGYFILTGAYNFSWEFFFEKLIFADMVYHLYFILIITQFYFLFGVFRYLFVKFNSHILILIFFLSNLLFMNNFYFKYVDRFFMQYIFFFALGFYLSKNYQEFKPKILANKFIITLSYLSACGIYAFQFIYMSVLNKPLFSGQTVNNICFIFSLISIIFYLLVSIKIEEGQLDYLKRFFYKVSDGSYYIYLSHPFVLILAEKVVRKLGLTSASLSFIILTFIVLGVTISGAIGYKSIKNYLNIFTKPKVANSKI